MLYCTVMCFAYFLSGLVLKPIWWILNHTMIIYVLQDWLSMYLMFWSKSDGVSYSNTLQHYLFFSNSEAMIVSKMAQSRYLLRKPKNDTALKTRPDRKWRKHISVHRKNPCCFTHFPTTTYATTIKPVCLPSLKLSLVAHKHLRFWLLKRNKGNTLQYIRQTAYPSVLEIWVFL